MYWEGFTIHNFSIRMLVRNKKIKYNYSFFPISSSAVVEFFEAPNQLN